jgi:hypothetical protein
MGHSSATKRANPLLCITRYVVLLARLQSAMICRNKCILSFLSEVNMSVKVGQNNLHNVVAYHISLHFKAVFGGPRSAGLLAILYILYKCYVYYFSSTTSPGPLQPRAEPARAPASRRPFQDGRRIFTPSYYHEQLRQIGKHEPLDCSVADMVPVSEVILGGRSALTLKCTVCTMEKRVFTEEANPQGQMDINTALVSSMVTTGGGYSQLQEIQASLNMPCMSRKTWSKYHTKVHEAMHDSAYVSMLEAGKEEARLAIVAGDVDIDGVPVIMVIADGAWAKRSYKTNYNSASGVVVIIGYRTRKVLFLGVRNKYCSFCEYHKRQASTSGIPDHMCF